MSKNKEIKKLKKELELVRKKLHTTNEDKLILANVLSKINEELEESLHQEKRFIASVSHELRTPMTSIIGYGELLEDTTLDAKQKRYVQSIKQSSNYLLSLINDLLDVAKFKDKRIELNPKVTDITDIISECAILIESKIADEVNFQVQLPTYDFKIKADEKRLKQIILNLLSNAAKFTKKGTITLYVDEIIESKENQLELTIHIEDTGNGIPKEVQETLFEPFSSTDKTQGTGLGLFISQELASLMDGSIMVNSKEGKGSQFILTVMVEKSAPKEIGRGLIGTNILMCSQENAFVDSIRSEFGRMSMQNFEHFDIKQRGIDALISERLVNAKLYNIVILDIDILGENALSIAKMFLLLHPNIKLVAYLREDIDNLAETFPLNIYKPLGHQSFIRKIERSYSQRKVTRVNQDYTNLKILLVEDVEINRIYEVEMLKNFFGIVCDTAENGLVALNKAKAKEYDLILMDMRMPVMDGLEATKKIRTFNSHVPIVCMSANVYKEDKMAAEESGMNDFIEKPLERKDIENTLVKLLTDELIEKRESFINYEKVAKDFLRENFDEMMVNTLYKAALKSIMEGLTDIQTHSNEEKLPPLREDFHKLKGVLLNLGLKQIATQAEELQQYVEREDVMSLKELQKSFVETLSHFVEVSLD